MFDWIRKKLQKRKDKGLKSALTLVEDQLEELRKEQKKFEGEIRDADHAILQEQLDDDARAKIDRDRDFRHRKLKVIKASIVILEDEVDALKSAQLSQPVLRILKKSGKAKKNFL